MNKLDYVLAVAEEKNLSRAAEHLYVSQPTLTLYLNRLEGELGVKLFDRSKQPITLTVAGRYYIDKMKRIASEEQSLRRDLKAIAEPQRTLKIGIGQVRGHHWLPTILPIFCARYPEINVEIVQGTETQMLESLQADRLDIAFGALPPTISDMAVVELSCDPLLLVAHWRYGLVPSHLRSENSIKTPYVIQPECLNGLPCITPQVSNGLYAGYQKMLDNHHIVPGRTIVINNLSTGLYLAVCGLGVQLIYTSMLQQNNVPGIAELDFIKLDNMPQSRKCVAAYHDDNIKLDMISDFIKIVKEDLLPYCFTNLLY